MAKRKHGMEIKGVSHEGKAKRSKAARKGRGRKKGRK
jgi:hypothetical protein